MSGINIPQIIIALAEGYLVTESGSKALLYGVSVGLSNLLPGIYIANPSIEKAIAEPVFAGAIAVIGSHFMKKEQNYIKNFTQGFLIGSSSACVYAALLSTSYPQAGIYKTIREENIKTYPDYGAGRAINALFVS